MESNNILASNVIGLSARCKKCVRQIIDERCSLLTVHSSDINWDWDYLIGSIPDPNCKQMISDSIYFKESILPFWIIAGFQQNNWTKGKLFCPHCDTKVGYFDFITRRKCGCGKHVLPSVEITKSKVDIVPSILDSPLINPIDCGEVFKGNKELKQVNVSNFKIVEPNVMRKT